MVRKIFSRKAFETFLTGRAVAMAKDTALTGQATDLLIKSAEYHWIHQSKWFGEPVLNPAQDMFARQEIIFRTRPDYIIELGVAWGGSLLFYATLMEMLGGKRIIGVDTYIPPDLGARLRSHKKLAKRLTLINGSSTDETTITAIKKVIGTSRKLLVILDSSHTHAHKLAELQLYGALVGKGFYMICDDTFVEDITGPSALTTDRPWAKGDNPRTALREFLAENTRFRPDVALQNKLLISCNPDGYLECVREPRRTPSARARG